VSAPSDRDAKLAAFRREQRERCRALRRAAGQELRDAVANNVDRVVDALLRERPDACIAFYWPIHDEIALFPSMQRAQDRGAKVALPIVVAKDTPLVFREWTSATVMEPGVWNIPVPPASAREVDPHALLVPLVGYDDAGYRLGNGGGFYDRTLAARMPRPLAIGVGFTSLRMPTIRPHEHDRSMDFVVTEEPLDDAQLRVRIRAGRN
jgi:5-formyltetrahydrofolate cyclo-ligase